MPYLRLTYKTLHYTDARLPEDVPTRATLVLTHGLGSTQNYYGSIVPALTRHGYRCLAYDTTGAGRSPYTGIEQSVASLSADLVALMDALGLDTAVLVGHSMGGIVAAHVAATRPERVRAGVWIGPVLPSARVRGIFERRVEAVRAGGMEAMADSIPYSALGSAATPLMRAFVRELLLAQTAAGYISCCRVVAGAAVPDYEEVRAPVLLVAGEEDGSAPVGECREMFERVSGRGKEMVVLEGCGHWHCVESGEEVAARVVGFLGRVLAEDGG